jgi:hypothetical protein
MKSRQREISGRQVVIVPQIYWWRVTTKGKQLGRPKKVLDMERIASLRAKGVGWKRIAAEIGVGGGTTYRVALAGSKTRERAI